LFFLFFLFFLLFLFGELTKNNYKNNFGRFPGGGHGNENPARTIAHPTSGVKLASGVGVVGSTLGFKVLDLFKSLTGQLEIVAGAGPGHGFL